MSILHAIGTFTTDTSVAYTRETVGSYNADGIHVPVTATSGTFDGSIQPYKGRELKVLPEGVSASDVRLVLTSTALLVRDFITYDGATWTVFAAEPWNHRTRRWTRAYMARGKLTL
jgi:hypothetical protein